MYDEILVPTDGSDPSLVAVDEGIELANRFEGRVHFLNVVDVGTEMSAAGAGVAGELSKTFEDVAEEALGEAESRAREAGVQYERTVLEGIPHEAVEEYSAEHDIDIIVLGTSGRSGVKEKLLGSTTDQVAQSADCSVLIARP